MKNLILLFAWMVTWDYMETNVVPCPKDPWTGLPTSTICFGDPIPVHKGKRFKTFQEAQDFVKTRPGKSIDEIVDRGSKYYSDIQFVPTGAIEYDDSIQNVEIKEIK